MKEEHFKKITERLSDEELSKQLTFVLHCINQYIIRINRISKCIVFRVEDPIETNSFTREEVIELFRIGLARKDKYKLFWEGLLL